MSPHVERLELKGNDEGDIPIITVRLDDSEPFDVGEFDELVKDSMRLEYGTYALKYIACDDTMYIFPANLRHNKVEPLLRARGIAGKLQSAGRVAVILYTPDYSFRTIDDYSTTLVEVRLLSRHDSDVYKRKVIKEKLGNFFEVR